MSTAAIVLAGGRSRRMGRDKASLPFGDETLLERVVRAAREAAGEIVVVVREGQELQVDCDTLARDPAEGLGPLAGIAAGLEAMSADRAFVTACDAPFLSAAYARFLLDACEGRDAAVPLVDGYHMTTAAAYARTVLPVARELLAERRLRPLFLIERVEARILTEAELNAVDPGLTSLRNCNTPEEYEQALADAGFR
ncbi:MAG: molybdenum cofactor guanylyltransferase [Planctomycetota bacterium]|jgi:molybdopterin-guanine dinucleotide biosynthesis protein A